jgi:hypothetical protein
MMEARDIDANMLAQLHHQDERVRLFVSEVRNREPMEERWIQAYFRAPDHVRIELFEPLWALLLRKAGRRTDGIVHPSFPKVTGPWACRLLLGDTPEQITGFSKPWAHHVLRVGATDPLHAVQWLCKIQAPDLEDELYPPWERPAVVHWLLSQWSRKEGKAALLATRREVGPHGEVVEGRFADRVDELRDPDLRPSVRETFERCAKRMIASMLRQNATEILAPIPAWLRPMPCMTVLRTKAQLAAEGHWMKHCVGTYVGYVKQRESVIVAFRIRDGKGQIHRSTAEFSYSTGFLRQHRGPSNGAPPELCKRAMDVFLFRRGLLLSIGGTNGL